MMNYILYMILPIVLVIGKFIINYLIKTRSRTAPLVPGGIPFIGNVIGFNRKKPHLTLSLWGRKYGDIFRIKVFGEEIFVLNSSKLIREAIFSRHTATAGRPDIYRINYGFNFSKDVIFGTYSPKWVELKKLIVKGIKNYGYSSDTTEITSLLKSFSKYNNKEFDPSLDILVTVVNCLCSSILGKRFSADDVQLHNYKLVTRLFSEACSPVEGVELDLFPWLRFFGNTNFKKLKIAKDALHKWIDVEMQEAISKHQHGSPKCILDMFLDAHENTIYSSDKSIPVITKDDVKSLFIDMLVSSTFTTVITLTSFCLFLASDQSLQRQIEKQISSLQLENKFLKYEARKDVPLMEATVYEILRYISHVPLGLPHFTLENTILGGFDIPKNRKIILNLWNVHHNENVWSDAYSFNPARFINDNGQFIGTDHELFLDFLPFGGGRRACPGEALSKQRIFTIASAIIQHFHLVIESSPSGHQADSGDITDPRNFQMGLILEPRPFYIKAVQIKDLKWN